MNARGTPLAAEAADAAVSGRLNPFALFYRLLACLSVGVVVTGLLADLLIPLQVGSRAWFACLAAMVLLMSGPLMLWQCVKAGMRSSLKRGHMPLHYLHRAGRWTGLTLAGGYSASLLGGYWLSDAGQAQAWLFGLGGALSTSLVGLAVWLLAFGRARANALAQEMTNDLRRLAKVVEHTSNAVIITDVQRRVVWVNRGFTQVTGYEPGEVLGASPGALLQCEQTDPATVQAMRDALNRVESFKADLLNRAKDGRLYWLTIEIQPLRDEQGVLQGFMAIETDITAVKQAQQRQASAETVLRGAIEAVGEAFVLFDPEDRVVFANDRYRELYNKSRELIVPGATFEAIIHHGVKHGQFPEALGREAEWTAERIRQHREGGLATVQHLDDGRVIRVAERRLPDGHTVGFRIDITDLTKATEAAQELGLAKGRFLANMSHEIRTPMNAIVGMTELLADTELNDDQHDLVTTVRESSEALLTLINDILDYSKIEAGQLQLENIEFDLAACVSAATRVLASQAINKGLKLEWVVMPDVQTQVVGDPHRIRQVLLNLLSNAIKFTAKGSVRVTVKRLAGEVPSNGVAALHFMVEDTGIGVPANQLDNIFEVFTQADSSTTRKFGGTGLGLSICRSIVERMNGKIWVESHMGRGSCFQFTASLAQPTRVRPPPTEARSAVSQPVANLAPVASRVVIWHGLASTAQSLGNMAREAGYVPQLVASIADLKTCLDARGSQPVPLLVCASAVRDLSVRALGQALGRSAFELSAMLVRDQELPDSLMTSFPSWLRWPVSAGELAAALAADGGFVNSAVEEWSQEQDTKVQQAADVPQLKLLLAEDHPVNQKLAVRMLRKLGHEVEVVDDGAAAVKRCAQTAYDLVLMDVQMPVMGGFVATHCIRQADRAMGRYTPIVAMTAHAMAGDRERCLAVGMDGYLSKPITVVSLSDAIQQHASRAATRTPLLKIDLPPPVVEPGQGFDAAAALARLGGDEELLAELVESFLERETADREALQAALAAGDWSRLSATAHAIRGAAMAIGADGLAAVASKAEAAARQGHPDSSASTGAVLASVLARTVAELRA
jgi:PAS domain S-box-containing protein